MTDPTDGSAAAALGYPILTGLEKLWTLWEYINSTRDMLANFIASGSLDAAIIDSGILDAARIPGLDGAKITTGQIAASHLPGLVSGAGTWSWDGAAWLGNGNLGIGGFINVGGQLNVNGGPIVSPWARANGISGGLSIYVRSDGVIGIAASSRRFKKDIRAASIDVQAVLAMRVVQFRYKVAIDPDGADQVGLIAEELDALGLDWLVAYDDDGLPYTVHYEKLALALLPVVQDHERRIAALEAQR